MGARGWPHTRVGTGGEPRGSCQPGGTAPAQPKVSGTSVRPCLQWRHSATPGVSSGPKSHGSPRHPRPSAHPASTSTAGQDPAAAPALSCPDSGDTRPILKPRLLSARASLLLAAAHRLPERCPWLSCCFFVLWGVPAGAAAKDTVSHQMGFPQALPSHPTHLRTAHAQGYTVTFTCWGPQIPLQTQC